MFVHFQVVELLEVLCLARYKAMFIEEGITGALLKEVDEDILEQDLGISSKLHRLKLMRVIEGRESLDELFN